MMDAIALVWTQLLSRKHEAIHKEKELKKEAKHEVKEKLVLGGSQKEGVSC